MAYIPPKYPSEIPSAEDLPDRQDDVDWLYAARYNELKKELRAALIELGVLPKGVYADVKARLDAIVGGFTDRGDPAAWDFSLGDLITDGTWRDLNLSAIVPAGTKAVLLQAHLNGQVANSYILFRKNGNTNVFNQHSVYQPVTNIVFSAGAVIACDVNRVIEYNARDITWNAISLLVRGWWE